MWKSVSSDDIDNRATTDSVDKHKSVAHFMNHFSIAMQIQWKIGFSVYPLYSKMPLPNFAHVMCKIS